MSFISNIQSLQMLEQEEGKLVHLLFPDQHLADAFCTRLNALSDRRFIDKLSIKSFVYHSDRNLCLQYLATINAADSAILIGPKFEGLKLAFDHLQLLSNTFAMTSLVCGYGGTGDSVKALLDVGRPALSDCALLGLQEHKLHEDPEHPEIAVFAVHLAHLNQNIAMAEPIIRRSTLLQLDANLLMGPRQSGVGLSVQQMAQIAHYGGRGTKPRIISLTNVDHTDTWLQEALATMVWYYLYGLTLRSEQTGQMQEFVVEGKVEEQSLSFHRNNKTQHWWCHRGHQKGTAKFLPCSYEDYHQVVSQQELSPWLEFILALEEEPA